MFVFPVSSSVPQRGLRRPVPRRIVAAVPYPAAAAAPHADRVRIPPLDVVEAAAGFTAKLDMPGIAKEQCHIAIDGRRVEVSTQTETAAATDTPRYARSFVLPADLDPGAAQARLTDGVLTLTLPKRAAARLTVQ